MEDDKKLVLQTEETKDFSPRVTYSYITGAILATNALKDVYTVVDGPDCVHMKTQFVQGNHDFLSTLVSVSGHHRVANTALHVMSMATGWEDHLRATLERVASHPHAGGVLLTSMPMAQVTAVDYERLCKEVSKQTCKPVVPVMARSLTGDWLDGYEDVLVALAKRIDLPCTKKSENKVGIVGYLMDRNEGDHKGNIKEIRRIFGALGLEVVSIWLEGQPFASLARIAEASTIISFPYGRRAARWVARRTGARLVECDYPFGLIATEHFVSKLGEVFGRTAEAKVFLKRELSEVVPPCEFVIPFIFQHRRAGYIGDPVLVKGFYETLELFGATLDFAVITNSHSHAQGLTSESLGGADLLVYPRNKTLITFLVGKSKVNALSLVVTNNAGVALLAKKGLGVVEFGFPSYLSHSLGERPFLGFRGFLNFVDSMATAMRMAEAQKYSDRFLFSEAVSPSSE